MRKFLFTLMSLITASTLTVKAQSWCEDLVKLNPDVIDSVCVLTDESIINEYLTSYMIYYHQPLQHDAPELGSFPLRAHFTINSRKGEYELMDKMIQMSIGGYELSDTAIIHPNHYVDELTTESPLGEIAAEYNGHLLMPEHRYFGKSHPEDLYATLGYCDAKEAAADFHALAEAMKKVFHGKWCISGVSKGGMAAAAQHAYYPEDADFFVPYVAPVLKSLNDMRVQERVMSEAWTPELRNHVLHIQKEIYNRPDVYEDYSEYEHGFLENEAEDSVRCKFLFEVTKLIFDMFMYQSRSKVEQDIASNQQYLKECGLDDYSDDMLDYMIFNSSILLDDMFKASQEDKKKTIGILKPTFGVDGDTWNFRTSTDVAFAYQIIHELGYFGLKWDYFYDTQAEKDSVNAIWKNNIRNAMDIETKGMLKDVEFDPSLMNLICQQTQQATKPMIFIYGGDDLWTGAHIEDQYINGDNVRRYILPEQNHGASIFAIEDEDLKDEIWQCLHKVFRNNADAIEQIEQTAAGAKTRYNLLGMPVGDDYRGIYILSDKMKFTK